MKEWEGQIDHPQSSRLSSSLTVQQKIKSATMHAASKVFIIFEVKGREKKKKTHLKFWPKYIVFVSFFVYFYTFYNVCFCPKNKYCIVYNELFHPQVCQPLNIVPQNTYVYFLFSKTYYGKYSGNKCVIYTCIQTVHISACVNNFIFLPWKEMLTQLLTWFLTFTFRKNSGLLW